MIPEITQHDLLLLYKPKNKSSRDCHTHGSSRLPFGGSILVEIQEVFLQMVVVVKDDDESHGMKID